MNPGQMSMQQQQSMMQQAQMMNPGQMDQSMMHHIPMQQPHPMQQVQQHPIIQEAKYDYSSFRQLFQHMQDAVKETLRNAGINISNNAHIEQGSQNAGDVISAKFEESLERFYAICDQMELHLKFAIEGQSQSLTSQRHTPASASAFDSQKYSLYLNTVKNQISCAREMHSILVDAATISARPNTESMTSMESSS